MSFDDIIYLGLLFFSIGFGYFYRTIPDVASKRNIGTLVGLIVVLIVSGFHILHSFLTVFINAFIIIYIDSRKCHLISFAFSFLYLFFFRSTIYFGIPYPPAHTNLVQMMLTLKMVGLAMEVNSAYNSRKKKDSASKSNEEMAEDASNDFKLDFVDVFHYAFNYVGVLTGPYYRYRTYKDFLDKPFSIHADWKAATIDKLKYIPFYAALFLWGSYNWPLSYATSKEFYSECSWLYRYWYIWPNFFIFRMRIYIGLMLSECVCTMVGLGAYPSFSKAKSGEGPTENFIQLRALNKLDEESYDFETIHNINPYGAEFVTTCRESMKHWNICIQYWLAVNVYKRFPSRKFRTIVTLLVSSIWHGIYTGYYLCIATVPLVLVVEDVWVKILLKDKQGPMLKVSEWIIWFFRMQIMSYQAIAFLLLELRVILTYYNSIYHCLVILYAGLYILGIYILKVQRLNKNKKTEPEEQWEQVQEKKKIR